MRTDNVTFPEIWVEHDITDVSHMISWRGIYMISQWYKLTWKVSLVTTYKGQVTTYVQGPIYQTPLLTTSGETVQTTCRFNKPNMEGANQLWSEIFHTRGENDT